MQFFRSQRVTLGTLMMLLVVGLLLPTRGAADEVYAKIRGTVTDSSGGVLPGAKITATNVTTGQSTSVTSNDTGNYEFLQLPIGSYKVSASKDAFKNYQTSPFTLVVNQIYVLSIRMEVGATSETITVEANSVQVETTSNQLGTVITNKTITDLPMNGRNWIQLQLLQPGVVGASDRFNTGTGGTNFSTNGSQSQQNSFLVNGVDTNDLPLNTALLIPSPDAIAEFNMVTNTINPEFGRNSGAVLNAVIKQGTNRFHGNGFWFYRDTSLNTKGFFQTSPQVFHRNEFGGTIGGPIWKNKTFFFFSYQGDRRRTQQDIQQNGGIPTVFTQSQLNGNFSTSPALPSFNGDVSPIAMFDSNGVKQPAGTAYSTLWPNGVIPTSNFNSISNALVKQFVPLPNFNGNQFSFNPVEQRNQDQEIIRLDHSITPNDSLWGTIFLEHIPTIDTLPFLAANLPGFAETAESHSKQYVLAYNHTFSSTMLNEIRVGYTRLNFVAVEPLNPVLPSSLGFQINPQLASGAGIPRITVDGFFTLGSSTNGPQPRIDQTYQFTDNFSKTLGRHSMKFGFEMRRFHVTNPFSASNNGQYSFSGAGPFSTGDPGLDFLLGIPDSFAQNSGGKTDAYTQEYYSYAQDSFKLRNNLTLNYGVGWQIDVPLYDTFNHGLNLACLSPGQQSTVFPLAPTGMTFPGDKGCNSAGGPTTSYQHFGPRFGFAYSPDWGWISGGPGKLSIRAGYGIYFNRGEEELTLQNIGTPPFGIGSTGVNDNPAIAASPAFANPYAAVDGSGSIANKFPFVPPQPGAAVDFTNFEPMGFNVIDPNFVPAYSQNYNLTIQRELPGRMVATVAYVGSEGRHEQTQIDRNPLINPAACAANPACVGGRVIQHQLFPNNSPLPGDIFTSINGEFSTGTSNYNSLQASLNKAPTHGLSFLLSYTYAHSHDIQSSFENGNTAGTTLGTNPFNPKSDYADSLFDARHRMVLSLNYDVPNFRHAPGMGWIPDRISNGWRISGIETLQTGLPVVITDSGFTSLTCDGNQFNACWDLPNRVGSFQALDPRTASFVNKSGTTLNHYYFDPSIFSVAPFGTIGNAGRNPFHGPGINNTDAVLAKNLNVTESTYFEFRLEAFNVFNHTQFNAPNGNVRSANFGRITSAASPRLVQLGAKFYF